MNVSQLIRQVGKWAEQDGRVVAAALCGSHARGEALPDSDVDFCIVSTSPMSLLSERSWLCLFGDPQRVGIEDWGFVRSLRVHYSGGLEVEFGIAGLEWITPPIDGGTSRVMLDPMRVLFDPDARFEKADADAAARHAEAARVRDLGHFFR